MKTRPDDELKNILTELVDKHFPKHECQERGQAMVLAAEALRAFAAHTEAACKEARIDELEIKRSDYEDMLRRTWMGFNRSIPKFWIEAELGVLDNEVAHLTSEKTKWVQGGLDKSSEQIDIEIEVEDD